MTRPATLAKVKRAVGLYNKGNNHSAIGAALGVGKPAVTKYMKIAEKLGLLSRDVEINEESLTDEQTLALLRKAKRVVVTSAQNATPVHSRFWSTLLAYCKKNNAALVVIPYRYHNPTSTWSQKARDADWWDRRVKPYLLDQRVDLNPHLTVLGDIKTQPTANDPLRGFEAMSGAKSAIIGHPKLEMNSVPTPAHKLPKLITTTGSVTKKNYTPSKAGKKGEFHHTFGAIVAEIKGDVFHLRQLNAIRDGSFIDLGMRYSGDEAKWVGVSGIVLGDFHEEFKDPKVVSATFGKRGIIETLMPRYVVWHDVHDFYARNHHHIGEPFIDYAKHVYGTDDVKKALFKTFDFIRYQAAVYNFKSIMVPSNHPDAFTKWVKRADWRYDPRNAEFLLETAVGLLREAKAGREVDAFGWWGRQMVPKAIWLNRDDSYVIRGIEVGLHGDIGSDGSRGTRKAFTKIGPKVIIGHTHSPGIKEGVYQTGTSSLLRLEYNRGPSSWLQTHCLIYPNGKRCLINIIEGEWRA